MTPPTAAGWRYPLWRLAALLAGLSTLGPFAIDTYLPAFGGIGASLGATPAQMQQSLSAYLFGFAVMNLFHGALSDALGRRPVVLTGLAVFTLASIGCALSGSLPAFIGFRALQGLSAGAGSVVARAIIRDLFPPAWAQRVMSQITLFFGAAPAIAPVAGGWLFVHLGWASIFWALAGVGLVLGLVTSRWLPESLPIERRQRFAAAPLLGGYARLVRHPRFLWLVLASSVPFNGMFLYVLSAPEWLGRQLGLGPTQYGWFFITNVAGIMGGAWLSGRLAGRIAHERQVGYGFAVMAAASLLNLAVHLVWPPDARLAIPLIAVYALGWALMMPVITLQVLDLVPSHRGTASSLQACIGSVANGLVAGVLAPLVMHRADALAAASLALLAIGLFAWWRLHRLPPTAAVVLDDAAAVQDGTAG